MALSQLLGRQSWTEIGVVFPNQAEGFGFAVRWHPIVAGSTAPARNKPGCAFLPVALQQPPELPIRDLQPFGGHAGPQLTIYDRLDGLEPV
jgi:hypothetical protein